MSVQHIRTGPVIDNIIEKFQALQTAHAKLQKQYSNLQKRVQKRIPKTSKRKIKTARTKDTKK